MCWVLLFADYLADRRVEGGIYTSNGERTVFCPDFDLSDSSLLLSQVIDLNGEWKLVYTSNSELTALLALSRLPFVTVGDITQTIDGPSLTVINKARHPPRGRRRLPSRHSGEIWRSPVISPVGEARRLSLSRPRRPSMGLLGCWSVECLTCCVQVLMLWGQCAWVLKLWREHYGC